MRAQRIVEFAVEGEEYAGGRIVFPVGGLTVLVDDGGGGAYDAFADFVASRPPHSTVLHPHFDDKDCLRDLGVDDWGGAFRTLLGPVEGAEHRHRDLMLEPEYVTAAQLIAEESDGRLICVSSLGNGLAPKMQGRLAAEVARQCAQGSKQVIAWTRNVGILRALHPSAVMCFARDADGLVHAAPMHSAPTSAVDPGGIYEAIGCQWVISRAG